jgi:hypothetical protein
MGGRRVGGGDGKDGSAQCQAGETGRGLLLRGKVSPDLMIELEAMVVTAG